MVGEGGQSEAGGEGGSMGGGGMVGGVSAGNGGAAAMGQGEGPTVQAWMELEASGEDICATVLGEVALTHGTHLKSGEGIDPVQFFALWPWRKQRRHLTILVHVLV